MATTYTVKAGDTKGKLKQLFGIDYNFSGYRSSDPNKLFAGEVLTIPDASPALNFSPVNPIAGTYLDLSKVSAGVKPVNMPDPVLPPIQNTPIPAIPSAQTQTQPAQDAKAAPKATQQTTAQKTDLMTEETTLRDEIAALEQKIAGADQNKVDGYTADGIYNDVQKLNDMKANLSKVQDQLYTLQDAPVSIAADAKAALSGNQGTTAAYDQITQPQLEQNAVDTLAKSREYARLGSAIGNYSDAINSRIAIVDQRVNADTERQKVLLESKAKRLKAIEDRNTAILTEAQKLLLEDKKQQNAIELENLKSNQDLKKSVITEMIKTGAIDQSQIASLLDMDTMQVLSYSQNASSSSSWLQWDQQKAANLPADKYKIWQTYNGLDEATKKEVAARKPASDKAALGINTINNMLANDAGLSVNVGTYRPGFSLNPFNIGSSNTFSVDAKNLVATLTSDALLNLKAAGGTLGAISEKELSLLQDSSSNLGIDPVSGKSTLPQNVFKDRLKQVREHSQRLYLSLQLSESEYNRLGYDKATQDEIDTIYSAYKSGNLSIPTQQTTSAAPKNRAQANNNPLNIKASSYTTKYSGVVGTDPKPALDGGNFLKFDSPQSGFNAAATLLKTSGYQSLTVDQAMKRWSNSGYGGDVLPQLAARKMNTLSQSELLALVQAMAQREGFYA